MNVRTAKSLLEEGVALQARGRWTEAAACFDRVVAEAPAFSEGWHQRGMLALLQGHAGHAAESLGVALQLNPASWTTAIGLGVARIAAGEASEAEAVLRRLTRRQPRLVEAWNYLALALENQGKFDEAVSARERVVKLNPRYAAGWSDFGSALSSLGRQADALRCFTEAIALAPTDVQARLGRAMVLYKCHRVGEAVSEYEAIIASQPTRRDAQSFRLLALNNLDTVSRERLFAEHKDYGRQFGAVAEERWVNTPEPERRLRLAFLSPDLREHSVGYFIEPLVQHLEPESFEILIYHDSPQVDRLSDRLRARAAVWRNVAGRTEEMLEAAIRADAPDVLVDLAGHSGASRLPIFARRAAPVQITYLGYPNTTGVAAMDYRFVDPLTDPEPLADAYATERLVRFSPCMWAYSPPMQAPEVAPPPCLKNGFVTFGAFNNFAKASDETLRMWSAVLAAVPGSRLLIKAEGLGEPGLREPIVARMAAAGLPLDRVDLRSRTPDTCSHLRLYHEVDVALDTFPYHGTTTTCEALWMGVPVVTRVGDRHAARVGLSLLSAVGRADWAALTIEEYAAIAQRLATDQGALQTQRRMLREDVRNSILCDHAGQAARFADAIREGWRSWCQRQHSVPIKHSAVLSNL